MYRRFDDTDESNLFLPSRFRFRVKKSHRCEEVAGRLQQPNSKSKGKRFLNMQEEYNTAHSGLKVQLQRVACLALLLHLTVSASLEARAVSTASGPQYLTQCYDLQRRLHLVVAHPVSIYR